MDTFFIVLFIVAALFLFVIRCLGLLDIFKGIFKCSNDAKKSPQTLRQLKSKISDMRVDGASVGDIACVLLDFEKGINGLSEKNKNKFYKYAIKETEYEEVKDSYFHFINGLIDTWGDKEILKDSEIYDVYSFHFTCKHYGNHETAYRLYDFVRKKGNSSQVFEEAVKRMAESQE